MPSPHLLSALHPKVLGFEDSGIDALQSLPEGCYGVVNMCSGCAVDVIYAQM